MKALLVLLCLAAPAIARVGEKLTEFKARIVAPVTLEKAYKNGLTLSMFETNAAKVSVYSVDGVIVRETYSGIDEDLADGILMKQPGKWQRLEALRWRNGDGLDAYFSKGALTVTSGKAEPLLSEIRNEENGKKLERF